MMDCIVPLYLSHPSLYPIVDRFFTSVKESYPDLNMVVIDDCSPLTIPHTWPVTYRNEENRGYTATVNTGLQMSTAERIIIANDDLIIKPGDLDRFYQMEGLVICSPRDTASSPDDRFGSIWGMTRETFKKLGYLNEEYRHFYSDLDYYTRAKEAGITVIKWNDILIDHCESATYNTLDKESLLKADSDRFLQNNQ